MMILLNITIVCALVHISITQTTDGDQQINAKVDELRHYLDEAARHINDHRLDTLALIKTSQNETIAIDADHSESLYLARVVTTQYFNYFDKVWHGVQSKVGELMKMALHRLQNELKPWTSKKLLQSIGTAVETIIKEVVQMLLDVGNENQKRLVSIHADVVRQLLALQHRAGIFLTSQWFVNRKNGILTTACKDVDRMISTGGVGLKKQFDRVVVQLLSYVQEVLHFADENDIETRPLRSNGFDV